MEQIGKVFRQLRESRNISLRQATGGQFSPSMLSRFETGQSELSVEKFLGITLFSNLYNRSLINDGQGSNFYSFNRLVLVCHRDLTCSVIKLDSLLNIGD